MNVFKNKENKCGIKLDNRLLISVMRKQNELTMI